MKTFMNSKYSYLMAAAVLAGSMSFSACSNEEDVINPLEGPKSSVTLGLSVAGLGTKATAGEVNLGGTDNLQTIQNIVVAPMVAGQYSYPIALGNLDPKNGKTTSKKVQLANTVNRFRVFGNVPDLNANEANAFTGFTYTPGAADVQDKDAIKPYALLYHADTEEEGFYAATGTWGDIVDWGTKTKVIGNNTAIKVDNVRYAVGVLAVAVLDGLKDGGSYPEIAYDSQENATNGTIPQAIDGSTFQVAGVMIGGQRDAFTDNGWSAESTKNVYETAATAALAQKAITNAQSNQNVLADANIYSVVTPTKDANTTVDLNIRMQNVSEKYIKMADGTIVAPQGYVYFPVLLDATKVADSAGKAVFAEATTTILNLTIKKWDKGTQEPTETTELEMGIEVNMSWEAGLVFDQTI